jgi:prefoldin subunit 5
MKQRLAQLKQELEKGRQRLELLERERQEVRDTMLRISGAIQVLDELQAGETGDAEQSAVPAELQSVA